MTLDQIVDLDRYPIDDPLSKKLAQVIDEAKTQLQKTGCAVLKGFMRSDTVTKIAAESRELRDQGHHTVKQVAAYPPTYKPSTGDWPIGHPRLWSKERRNRFISYDLIPVHSPLRKLYESKHLTDLIRRCSGTETLYAYSDPLGACALSMQNNGEELPWHFDTTHFVTSILIQKPTTGGEFQYVPYIKTETDQNYKEVAKVFAGESSAVITLDLRPGDLQLFEGRFSLHRVTSPKGTIGRSIALLSYCEAPGEMVKRDVQMMQYGRVNQKPLLVDSTDDTGE